MITSLAIETAVRRMFEEQWHELLCQCQDEDTQQHALMQCCPVSWMIDDLLQLVTDTHSQPVSQLEATIRRIVMEQDFVGNMGNVPIGHHRRHDLVDQYVEMLVGVLEQVRQRALECGQWSNAPLPPQFFG